MKTAAREVVNRLRRRVDWSPLTCCGYHSLIAARRGTAHTAGVAELADAQDLGSCTARCRGSTPLSCMVPETVMVFFRSLARSSTLALALAGCAAVGTGARADSLWVSSGGTGKPLQDDNVQITRVEGGALFFRAPNGNETKRDFKQVVRM